MTRAVRQINVPAGGAEDATSRPFSEFVERTNIILLGDPGAGKTHLFYEAAAAEKARFIKARSFLNTPTRMLCEQVLFIDGLDEKRAGRGDRDTVDALVKKLFEVAPPKLRISCRAADWLGESDLAAMSPFFDQQGGACVLHLESLSRSEQMSVLMAQGLGGDDIEGFLNEAAERGLGDFLENPQNLIMLWSTVKTGAWPATRRELFERSTRLMLEETNPERARSGGGSFSVAELRPVAGAVCAARLISDVDGISLTDQEGTPDIPGYRSLDLFPPEKVQAVLGRRVFDAGPELETVDYAHRTTAEFLAADFLASRMRKGLPFGRVMALMGVDRHPASELRGLHAWLAVCLPEHADELIEADPYGVLTYGDAASLSPRSCAVLVRALARLSHTNPWFRSGNWQAQPIGALARPDMVLEFRAILNDPDSGFGIRSVVVDALALGTPLPAILPDLETVLLRQVSPYAERLGALKALLRLGDAGKAAIRSAFGKLGNSADDLRLRAAIVQALYDDPYGPDQVVALVNDTLQVRDTNRAGLLWSLAEALPEQDLPAILDGIEPRAIDDSRFNRRIAEAGSFYERILVRAWSSLGQFEPARVMGWLRRRLAFERSAGQDLHAALRATPDRLHLLAKDFFSRVPVDDNRWLAYNRFREATLFELSPAALLAIATHAFDAAQMGSDRRSFLYEVVLSLSIHIAPVHGTRAFDELYLRAEHDELLRPLRSATVVVELPSNYFIGRSSRAPRDLNDRARQQREFDQNIDKIRSGAHLGWLQHLALIYFGLYADSENNLSPRERIGAWLGEGRVDAALEALAATLARNDLPSFNDVLLPTAEDQHYGWWYALIAGLNERWAAGQGLVGLSDDFLKGMLVFDLANPVWTREGGKQGWAVHPWRKELTERKPELVRDAYFAVAQLHLSRSANGVIGLRELLHEPAFEPYRPVIVLDLLRQFPNANPPSLCELLDAISALPAIYQDFLKLAGPVISGTTAVDERQYDLWMVTAYFIAPAQFENDVERRARSRPNLVFDLRDRSGFAHRAQPHHALPLPMLEFIAKLTGSLFPETPAPESWQGDTNPWDASDHFRALVNMISASPSPEATDALQRLEADAQLAPYKSHLLYALHNQRQRRRESEYDRPDWLRTIGALANRAPATVADLHAVLLVHLRDLAHRIARENTDLFKKFWNVDSNAKLIDPRPEEVCRDDVVDLLRPALLPLGVTVEPEGHMVADKRADISAAMPGRKILCELKRNYHAEVWKAITGQLERFYAHDPEAKGFGIYVVFWFGKKRARPMPRPPKPLQPPKTPAEMESTLQLLLPDDMRKRLAVIVMDVSGEI
ncbi:hypothetical protein MCBRY_001080 [Methylocystis bryophila]